ncbi:MAG: hypothetical protein WB699_10815 [Bacteroidota bacterium]
MRPFKMKLLPVLALAVLVAASAFGQSRTVPKIHDHQKLMFILETSLKSAIPGVVESTIYNMIEYKSYYPNLDFSGLINALDALSQASTDSSISYKAQLAIMYLRYGTSLDNGAVFNSDNHEYAFQRASEQLTRRFLLTRATQ